MARGKAYRAWREKVSSTEKYELAEAVRLVKEVSYTKFVGAVELHVKTGANPKYNDQMLRGTVVLPHGTGKTVRVAAYVADDKRDEAKAAGADLIGNQEILEAIQAGTMDFDVLVTTADQMRDLARVAKILGPKGLMPSPKAGTVSNNLEQTIGDIKKGRVEFKLDKTGNIHVRIAWTDFTDVQIAENFISLMKAVQENKPTGIKGKLVQKVVLAPTMGVGVQVVYNA